MDRDSLTIVFIVLLIFLILSLVFFSLFPLLKIRIVKHRFIDLCGKKVKSFSLKNNYQFISDLKLASYTKKQIDINHVIFANKFIYIVTDYPIIGCINGNANDNSWFHSNFIGKNIDYFDNLYFVSNKNIQEFTSIINIDANVIVSISVVPDECKIQLKNDQENKNIICCYSMLKSVIKNIEKNDIQPLEETLKIQYFELVKNKNEQDRKNNNI